MNNGPMISTTAETAYWYALKVIKGRWPEGEAAIATDPLWAAAGDAYRTEAEARFGADYVMVGP